MHTKRTILLIVAVIGVAMISSLAAMILLLGAVGLALAVGAGVAVLTFYVGVVRPRHTRWGATTDEAHGVLPGDGLVPDAKQSTRAVEIAAPPEEVWPWLVQIGYGRAGWYSYDWIDNDGQPSATRVVAHWQGLEVGDRILMMPDMGFEVREIDPPDHLVALADDGTTSWCLRVVPDGAGGSRLVSRFRSNSRLTPASAVFLLIADPGVFVMERKMLKGIAARVDRQRRSAANHPLEADAPPAAAHGLIAGR